LTIPSYRSNDYELIFEDRRRESLKQVTMCVVSNGQYLGGGFRVAPRASTSDGLLDVVVLKESGTLKRVDELVKMKSGNYADDLNILYEQTKKIKITSREREVGVTVDGEPIGVLPATFEIMPRALQLA
jgi:diacylglycerol kinase (ATP)